MGLFTNRVRVSGCEFGGNLTKLACLLRYARTEKVKRNWVWNGVKVWEGTWLSSHGVMGLTSVRSLTRGELRVEFKETNKENDLKLGRKWKSIPLLWWRKIRTRVSHSRSCQRPWEVEVGLDAISNEGSHGDTTVLSFDRKVTKGVVSIEI